MRKIFNKRKFYRTVGEKMKLGAMNDPKKDLYKQIEFFGEQKFDFLDLTIEPDKAYADDVDVNRIKALTKRYNLGMIGHTPWNLPIAGVYNSVREAALQEYLKCLGVFRKLGVTLVNVHPSMAGDVSDADTLLKYNIDFFRKITKRAKSSNIKIMVENTQGIFNEVEVLGKILSEVPGLKLHWDIGHANLGNEGEKKTKLAFHHFKKKIAHVHLSDNNGQEDQHLPIGVGNINWQFILQTLMEYKYNRTITLEVHAPDLSYLVFTRDKVKYLLDNITKEEEK